jgi:hypothetical protein
MAILNNSNAITTTGGYDVNNSVRFRSSASAYLSRTPGSAGNRQIWTWSGWVKRGTITSSGDLTLFSAGTTSPSYDSFRFTNDALQFFQGAGATSSVQTTQLFRDPSAWYHIVLAVDTTQATASNRIKIYVNGSQVTAFSSSSYPSQNTSATINNTNTHAVGALWITSAQQYFDGYMADVYFIDGSQKTPSDFGETDTTTGVWKPKAYTGTYGTNGFYLKFSDIATTSGSNAGLGKDFSGNANYWTTNNISVTAGTTYDAMIDSPTLTSATVANYPVISPLTGVTPTGGNLNLSGGDVAGLGTIAFPSTGKWYFEMVCGSGVTTTSLDSVGIGTTDINGTLPANKSVYMYRSNGNKLSIINGGSSTQVAYGATFVNGDVIGVAFDCDADTLTFYKNNTSQGTAFTSILSTTPATPFFLTVYARGSGGTSNVSLNAGQRPFAYTPPSGFVALNTYNLPDSTIVKGSSYMDAYIYTGDGNSTRTITFPIVADFVWSKNRTTANDNVLIDTVRGGTSPVRALFSNATTAEITTTAGWGGFGYPDSLSGTSYAVVKGTQATSYTNKLNDSYVNWLWQAGQGSTSSNTSGSITSTVSVNATAGFSVVTYTGTGANATIGHGLGAAPRMVIVKARSAVNDWPVYHVGQNATPQNGLVYLNGTNAYLAASTIWNNTAPTSTTFAVGTSGATNASGVTFVAYCWSEISGFSRFGSYSGGGNTGASTPNANGPFIYLGFRPKFVLIKRTSSAADWVIYDSVRGPSNANYPWLYPNSSSAEVATETVDFLSNGFKIRSESGATMFPDGATFIYAAFAENPFKNSLAR